MAPLGTLHCLPKETTRALNLFLHRNLSTYGRHLKVLSTNWALDAKMLHLVFAVFLRYFHFSTLHKADPVIVDQHCMVFTFVQLLN